MAWFARKKQESVVGEEEEVVVEEPRLPEPPTLDASGLRSVTDHMDYLLSLVQPLRPFGMSLLEAWDQVMCEDIDSMVNVPANSTAKIAGYAVRASDLVIRYGGEEFLIVLLDSTAEQACVIAEKIRAEVEALKIQIGSTVLKKTISIGIADFPGDSSTFWQAVKFADIALYQAKEEGRNRAVLSVPPTA